MDKANRLVYEFAGFRLDISQQTLTSPAGAGIAMSSRAFDVLRYLVERSGELVEKAALMQAVWPKTVVEENNLSQCIMAIRRALGEEAGERHFILTVPGRGYKFVAPVQILSDAPWRGAAGPEGLDAALAQTLGLDGLAEGASAKPPRPVVMMVLAGAVVVALAGAVLLYYWRAPPVILSTRYEQLTDVPDSATQPALSPDGHLLAFIREGSLFLGSGQLWLKRLPDGEPTQLTHESGLVFAPTFSADGTHVAYSVVPGQKPGLPWETWIVPVTGGTPSLLLGNASGLSYIGPHEVLYSEFKTGVHMGIVTSRDDRAEQRDVYLPSHERGMAHYGALSPDRKSVLVVEMGRDARWQRCRLVPFDGSSAGTPIGPPGACLSAAWSRDGKWMYLAVGTAGQSHLWRQGFPNGEPRQITYGAQDEQTVAVSPDGHSLLTSVGREYATLWLHAPDGDRPLTDEGYVWRPWLSNDGHRVYFLADGGRSRTGPQLWRMEIASGTREPLLSGFAITRFDVTSDEQWLVFTTGRRDSTEIWVAPTDHHLAPRRLLQGGDEIAVDAVGHIYFRKLGEQANFLHRMNLDGSDEQALPGGPIVEFHAVSPDGRWVTADVATDEKLPAGYLVPTDGGSPLRLHNGWYSSRWARDGKSLYVEIGETQGSERAGRTLRLRLGADGLPLQPATPVDDPAALIPHAEDSLSVSADPAVYAYVKQVSQSNIFRIPLP